MLSRSGCVAGLQLVPFCVAMLLSGAWSADGREVGAASSTGAQTTLGSVEPAIHRVQHPENLAFPDRGVLWLTEGFGALWTTEHLDGILRWVSTGRVCWIDTSLASRFGLTTTVGGSGARAVPSPEAAGHPLLDGVAEVRAPDCFVLMRGVPKGAVPILVDPSTSAHVVLAVWPIGQGVVIFRPPDKPIVYDWTAVGQRHWIEPSLADGARLLANLNSYSLRVMEEAGCAPALLEEPNRAPVAVVARERCAAPPRLRTLLEAYRVSPHNPYQP